MTPEVETQLRETVAMIARNIRVHKPGYHTAAVATSCGAYATIDEHEDVLTWLVFDAPGARERVDSAIERAPEGTDIADTLNVISNGPFHWVKIGVPEGQRVLGVYKYYLGWDPAEGDPPREYFSPRGSTQCAIYAWGQDEAVHGAWNSDVWAREMRRREEFTVRSVRKYDTTGWEEPSPEFLSIPPKPAPREKWDKK